MLAKSKGTTRRGAKGPPRRLPLPPRRAQAQRASGAVRRSVQQTKPELLAGGDACGAPKAFALRPRPPSSAASRRLPTRRWPYAAGRGEKAACPLVQVGPPAQPASPPLRPQLLQECTETAYRVERRSREKSRCCCRRTHFSPPRPHGVAAPPLGLALSVLRRACRGARRCCVASAPAAAKSRAALTGSLRRRTICQLVNTARTAHGLPRCAAHAAAVWRGRLTRALQVASRRGGIPPATPPSAPSSAFATPLSSRRALTAEAAGAAGDCAPFVASLREQSPPKQARPVAPLPDAGCGTPRGSRIARFLHPAA